MKKKAMRLHARTARAGLFLFLLLLSLLLISLPQAAVAAPTLQEEAPLILPVSVGSEVRQLTVLLANPWPDTMPVRPTLQGEAAENGSQVSLTLAVPGDFADELALLLFFPQGVALEQEPELEEVAESDLESSGLTPRPDAGWIVPPPAQASEEPLQLLLLLTVDESYVEGAPVQISLLPARLLREPPALNALQPSTSLLPQLGVDEAPAGSGSARLAVSFHASNQQRTLLFSLPAGLTAETSDPGLTPLQAAELGVMPPTFAGQPVSGWRVAPNAAQAELFTFQLGVAPDFGLGEPVRVALIRQEPATWWTVSALAPGEMNQLEAARQEPGAATATAAAAATATAALQVTSTVTPTLEATVTAAAPTAPAETAVVPPAVGQPTATTAAPEIAVTPDGGLLASLRENTGVLVVLGALLLGLILLLIVFLLRPKPATPPTAPAGAPAAARPAAPSGQPYLTLAGNDRRFPVNVDPFTIGRAPDNSLSIDESFPNGSTVSRYHASIYQQGGQYVIEDRNSQNGIWVNGRATAKNLLRDGWQVSVGGVDFVFHMPGSSR